MISLVSRLPSLKEGGEGSFICFGSGIERDESPSVVGTGAGVRLDAFLLLKKL